jgi:iron complex outermembrane recepter protein
MREVLGRSVADRLASGQWFKGGAVALIAAAALASGAPSAFGQQAPAPAAANPPQAPAAAPAVASADQSLEDIVVTARKRSESLQDIPASIQAIPESVIKDAHMTQLDDIGSMVSNLNIFEAHDNTPAVSMRGVGTFEVVQGVGFYMNDVQLYEGQTVRPNDIARIEVLKGPQGTLYGGANIGGAIKYVTKDPTLKWENEATIELGQYKTANVEAIVSGPISDKLGVRASLYDENHGGYITDTTYNERLGASQDRGGRIVLLAEPDHATNVRLSFNFDDLDSANQNLQYLVEETNIFGPSYVFAPYTADAYRYTVEDFFHPSYVRKLYSTTLEADHQFDSGIQLTSITNQFWSYNRGVTDLTKRSYPIDLLFQNIDHRVVSEELRLASTAHSNLDWLVGAFVQQHKTITQNGDNLFNMEFPPPCGPCYGMESYWGFDSDLEQKTQKQVSIFGDMTYYLGDWQYEVGLRAENYSSDLQALNQPPPPPLAAPNSPPLPPSPVQPEPPLVNLPSQSTSRTALSPRLSAQYKLSGNTNVYGTYAHGFTPGDMVEQPGSSGPYLSTIRPEVASSFELGAKTRFANGGHLNASVYFMNYKDRQYQSLVASPGGFFDINTNIGDSRNSGVELDFALPVTNEFKLSGGFGTTRAVWGNSVYLDPQATGANPTGAATYTNLKGLRAPFTPEYTANLALDWNHNLADGNKIGARVDASAIGQSYWDPNDYARQKAYQLMNLGVHYDTERTSWLAHVTNVTGTRFNTMYWDAWDVGVGRSFGRIDRPRTFTLSATYKF